MVSFSIDQFVTYNWAWDGQTGQKAQPCGEGQNWAFSCKFNLVYADTDLD